MPPPARSEAEIAQLRAEKSRKRKSQADKKLEDEVSSGGFFPLALGNQDPFSEGVLLSYPLGKGGHHTDFSLHGRRL
jgi:hypothetical protein